MCNLSAVMRFEIHEELTETIVATLPPDYYLTMVIGYVLVAILIPVLAALGVCIWVSRQRAAHG
jgi:hypothetical protein